MRISDWTGDYRTTTKAGKQNIYVYTILYKLLLVKDAEQVRQGIKKAELTKKLHRSTIRHHLQCILLKHNCKSSSFYETQTKFIVCVSEIILLLMTTAKFSTLQKQPISSWTQKSAFFMKKMC